MGIDPEPATGLLTSTGASEYIRQFCTARADASAVQCLKRIPPNPRRKVEYQIGTEFWQVGNTRLVIKRARKESMPFLSTVQARERAARRFFDGSASVVCGESAGVSELAYPFVPHPSLQALILERLDQRDPRAACDLLKNYSNFVRNLPSLRCVPHAFLNAFDLPENECATPVLCLKAGPIDLIPDNVLIGPNLWYICDNEFFFDFAVPVDLIIFRGVATLVNRLKSGIRSGSAPWDVVPFSGYARRRTYVPVPWIEVLAEMETSPRTLAKWSGAFERTALLEVASSCLCSEFLWRSGWRRPWWQTASDLFRWSVRRLFQRGSFRQAAALSDKERA